VLAGHAGGVGGVAFSPDGATLFSCSNDCSVCRWSISDDTPTIISQYLDLHFSEVNDVAVSPDAKLFASASADGALYLFAAETGAYVHKMYDHEHRGWCVQFSPDGNYLASCSADWTIRLWSVDTGQCVQVYRGHCLAVLSVAFSFDGKTLVSGGKDMSIRLWNTATGACTRALCGHDGDVTFVGFLHRGNTLVSSSADATVRIWDIETGVCVKKFTANWYCNCVAIAPNGKMLAIIANRTVSLWSLLDYSTLRRVALLLRIGVAPYVVLDIADFLTASDQRQNFCTESLYLHFAKISFINECRTRIVKSNVFLNVE
jgi:WD40 repeat protein